MLWLPATFVLDAILVAIFGNSPGKALVGIRVVRLNGSRPLFGDCLTRGPQRWTSGFGLGLPLVNLCTAAWQLGKGQAATYDEGWYMVPASGAASWRTVLVALVFFAFAGLLTASEFHA